MPDALILFGSVARGSESSSSDIDLLSIGGDVPIMSIKFNGIEIQNYSLKKLMSLAYEGNLFGAHLAMEGKALFDPNGIFIKYREQYRLKKCYRTEKQEAFDLAAFLLHHGITFRNKNLVTKRIAWAVRTVLIANLAEDGKFVFSPEGLYREFPYKWVEDLVNLRRDASESPYRKNLRRFLQHFDNQIVYKNKNYYYELFHNTKNAVAISTVGKLNDIDDECHY